MQKTKIFAVLMVLLLTVTLAPTMVAGGGPPFSPPGLGLTGGAFWAGTQDGSYAYTWVATHPAHYPNEREGVSPSTAQGEFRNTYGPNIRDFAIDGSAATTIILEGTVTLKNIGPYPETSYFEVGLGGSLNSWHQYFYLEPTGYDGSVYVLFLANNQGGYDIHIQDYATHYPGPGAVYRTTGTPGDDPVPEAAFHFVAEFDLVNNLAYLTVDGVSVDPVPFGKTLWAPYPSVPPSVDEDFDVPIGLFAGMVSEDTDNTGSATISGLKVTVE